MDISLSEVLEAHSAREMDGLYTCLPGRVVTYNPLTMTADIQIDIKKPSRAGDGSLAYEEYAPTLPAIPVVFPRCGKFSITFPLEAGDTVLLCFMQASIGEWRQGSELAEPADTRRHSEGYCVAIPGMFPDLKVTANTALPGLVMGASAPGISKVIIDETSIKLGTGATIPVALATPVQTLATALLAFATAAGLDVVATTTAAAANTLKTAITGLSVTIPSTLVKAL